MFFAERHGKLGRAGRLAHDRAEDLLTSTAFQLLRYLPPHDGLFAILRRTREVSWSDSGFHVDAKPPQWLTEVLARATGYAEPAFWLPWGEDGIPDVVLTLLCGERHIGTIVVEVKLDSGISGSEVEEGEDDVERRRSNQLTRYWAHLKRENTNVERCGLIYLTADAAPPHGELQDTLRHHKGMHLAWLSWIDVWSEMKSSRGDGICSGTADLSGVSWKRKA